MKVDIHLSAFINDSDLPRSYQDPDYLEEVIRENIEDVFIGADIMSVQIDQLIIEKEGDD